MALPSQMERSQETSRPVMSRSNRKANNNTQKIGITIAVVVVGLGLVFAAIQYLPSKAKTAGTTAGTKADSTDPSGVVVPKAATPLVGNEPKKETVKDLTAKPKVTPTTPAVVGPSKDVPTGGVLGTAVDKVKEAAATPVSPSPVAGSADPKPTPIDVTKDPSAPTVVPAPKPTGTGAPAAGPTPSETAPLPSTGSTNQVRSLIEAGDRAASSGKPLEARVVYSRALLNPDVSKSDAASLRDKAGKLNKELVFSPKVTAGDPLSEVYTVASGDALERIAKKRDLGTHAALIQRINGIANPKSLQIGQKIKLVRGPFHAVVSKSEYRLDLFWGSPDEPQEWLYIRSFPVGTGVDNGTPVGTFLVKKNSKLKDPDWTNPKTGEKFDNSDPMNPIGEYWLGWEGQGSAAVYTGFGLHGTIDPSSIGSQKSLGCVRMADEDIATVWEMLTEQISVVKVIP